MDDDLSLVTNPELVERVEKILEDVRCGDYTFEVREAHGGVILRASYMEPDTYTRVWSKQLTRKWVLSPNMTTSEIVQTAFKCAYTSYEHRVREDFRYKGYRIFGPHYNVNDLVELCRTRENAGGRGVTE